MGRRVRTVLTIKVISVDQETSLTQTIYLVTAVGRGEVRAPVPAWRCSRRRSGSLRWRSSNKNNSDSCSAGDVTMLHIFPSGHWCITSYKSLHNTATLWPAGVTAPYFELPWLKSCSIERTSVPVSAVPVPLSENQRSTIPSVSSLCGESA